MTDSSYRKQSYNGVCLCGHKWEDHHGQMVMNPDHITQTGESRVADECEHYGFNETGGLMYVRGGWVPHCFRYVDKDDPDSERKAEWRENLAKHWELYRRRVEAAK